MKVSFVNIDGHGFFFCEPRGCRRHRGVILLNENEKKYSPQGSICPNFHLRGIMTFILFQSASIMSILLGVCLRLISPNVSKKTKKKPQAQPTSQSMTALSDILKKTTTTLQNIHKFFNDYEQNVINHVKTESLTEELSALDMDKGENMKKSVNELRILIEQSYTKTFMNLKNVTNTKLNYLKMLNS